MLDAKIKSGEFKLVLPYRLPLILGHDVAGVVVRVGPRVRQFKPGPMIFASVLSLNSLRSRKRPWRSSPRH